MRLTLLYSLFALFSIAANIGAQNVWLHIWSGSYPIMASLVVGTGVGLIVKYVLDKKYIFRYKTSDALHDSKLFALYTLMGLVTTAIFWGFELGFEAIFGTNGMRYLGGILGLIIGYIIKYYLDKHFVFTSTQPTTGHV
jgi:hypothetical protein